MLNLYNHSGTFAGCDEAGRGCLAGPVTAASVVLDWKNINPAINDSKKLSEKGRKELSDWIKKNSLSWAVAFINPKEIDRINILQASIKAMHKALEKLTKKPDHIIVDGNYFHAFNDCTHETIVKGDAKFFSIAAASILAKHERDVYMLKLHKKNPEYYWNSNKGYPTIQHRKAIAKHGPTKHHRKSFRLLAEE